MLRGAFTMFEEEKWQQARLQVMRKSYVMMMVNICVSVTYDEAGDIVMT